MINQRRRRDREMSKDHNNEDIPRDRISSLPNALIHHIFSFLNMEDVVHTSILSNRWRYVWLSTPILNFNIAAWLCKYKNYSKSWYERRDNFMEFVSNVLILGKNPNIVKLYLFSKDDYFKETLLSEWIKTALLRCVQHVCLQIVVCRPLNFPGDLFTENIKVLELFITSGIPVGQLPSSLCTAPHLKVLKLRVVILPEGDSNGELILSCPCLETLEIIHCVAEHLKTLTICTPLLENLELELYDFNSYAYTSCVVKICTPNLKSLKLQTTFWPEGYTLVDYCLETLSSVVTAEFDIRETERKPLDNIYPYLMIPHSECLRKVLFGVHNVRSLKLSVYSIQVLTDTPELLERLPNLFDNLKCVMLMDRWASSVHAMLNFLERFPCIDTLVWERDFNERWKILKQEEWVADLPLENIFSCLETFEIHNFRGKEIELKFLKFLLQRAIHLKAVIIKTTKAFLSDEKLAEITDKLSSTPRASLRASISFQFKVPKDD